MPPAGESTLDESIARYEQYARLDPTNVMLLSTLGDHYHTASRFDDALQCYARCIELNPGDRRAQSRSALVMLSQHRFSDAETCIRNLINQGETDGALWHNLGLAQFYREDFDAAVQSFQSAVDRGLTIAANFHYLARALHHLERVDDALAAAERCVALDPATKYQGYLALLRTEAGQMASGFTLARAVLARDPENIDANVVAGTECVEQQANAEARTHFSTVLRNDRENGRAWLGLGLVLLSERQLSEAIEALQNAVRIYPTNSGMIVTLGWTFIVAKDPASAQKMFEHAIEVDRNFSESHAGLAAALALQGELDRAKDEIELAKRLDPRCFGAAVATSFIFDARGNKDAAANVMERLLAQSPRDGLPPLVDQLNKYLSNRR